MPSQPDVASESDAPSLRLDSEGVLVASPTELVEACFCVPAVRAMRNAASSSPLAVLAPHSVAPLWRTVSGVSQVLGYPGQASSGQIAKIVREAQVTAANSVAWEPSKASAALAKAKIAQRFGYDLDGLGKHLTAAVPVPPLTGPVDHRVRHYMDLVQELGIEGYVPKNFETPPLPERPQRPRIGIVPGSDFGESYCWGVDRFRELGEEIHALDKADLVILAYPGQTEEADELAARSRGRMQNFAHDFDLPGLLSAIPFCSLVVSNDSTVMHFAAHLGVPTVAIFGPGDPVVRRPLGRQHAVLSQYVDCSPCHASPCPLRHNRCLDELPVSRVFEAVSEILDRPELYPEPTASGRKR